MSFIVWLIVGGLLGWVASMIMGTNDRQGMLLNIVVGIVGAFLGGLIFRALDVSSPFGGLAGTIFVAFVGAVVLLLLLRVARRGHYRRV